MIELEKPTLMWHLRTWEDFKGSSWFTKMNYTNILMLAGFIFLAIQQVRSKMKASEQAGLDKRALKAPTFPPIEEQPTFDYKTTSPIKLRPFKPKYHLTMDIDPSALSHLDPSDFLLMDKNYPSRLEYRKSIMKLHRPNVLAMHDNPLISFAIREFYTFLMGTYLPLRFPIMFKLHEADYETGKSFMLENRVTGEIHPATVSRTTQGTSLLETLGKTLDEDFLFLLPEEQPESEKEQDPKYILQAYITVCPSGFNPSEKLGKRLAAIHEPVPGYKDKLEGSMDRFFAKLEVGKYVKRVNWSITTDAELYAAGSDTTHAHEGDEVRELEEIDVEKTFLRCERQTLHRLPTSQALVFAFKTYLYPLSEIKEEGLGEELATAIDGLKEGNVPQMHFYKRGAEWGEAVKRYLRS